MALCGVKTLIPVMIAGLALFLSLLGNMVCQFVSFETQVANKRDGDIFFGIWYYKGVAQVENIGGAVSYVDTCILYPNGTFFDSKWKTAKAFSIIAPVIGGVFWVWICFANCFSMNNALWRLMGIIFVFTCIFQGLTLVYLTSNGCLNNELFEYLDGNFTELTFADSCSMAWGAKAAIASTVLWFVAGVSMFVVNAPTKPERGPPEMQTVTYTKTTQPDGTEVITSDVVKGKAIPTQVVKEGDVVGIVNEEDVEEFR